MTTPNAAVTTAAKAIRASAVRTWTPVVVGLIVSAFGFAHIEIQDQAVLSAAISVVLDSLIALVFYVIVRLLELFKSSRWGKWLLGLGLIDAAPLYVKPAEVVTDVQGDPLS